MIRAVRLATSAGRGLLVGGVVLTIVGSLAPAASAWIFRVLIDAAQSGRGLGALVPSIVGVTVAGAVAVLAPSGSDVALRRLAGFMKVREHDDLFRSVNQLDDMATFDEPSFHSRLTLAREQGITASGEIITTGALFVQSVLLSVGFFVALFVIYPAFLLCAAVVAVPMVAIEVALGKTRMASVRELNRYGRERFLYSQAMAGYREAKEVRLLAIGGFLRRRAQEVYRRAIDAEHRLAKRELTMRVLASLLGFGFSLSILLWGVLRFRSGELSLGDLTVVATGGTGVIQGLSGAVTALGHVRHALGVQTLFEDIVETGSAPASAPLDGVPRLGSEIEFRDVWFRYPGRPDWAVKHASFRIRSDQLIAIVGANGSGKTTLAKLACRLYDPERGAILWDGKDLRTCGHASLRQRMGVLLQDFLIYEFSVSDNIGIGAIDHIDDVRAIEEAATLGGADAMIEQLPRGYETRLTRMLPDPEDEDEVSSGVLLSGGQEQRVTIARLLMRSDADVLVLDEPSSGLDPVAEGELMETLRECRAGRATVFITHRLGAARQADLVVVVADGTIAELGTHEELMARRGEYARLYDVQAAAYRTDD